MTTSLITAGDASTGLATTGGNDGALTIQTGAAGSKVNAIAISSAGAATFLQPPVGVTASPIQPISASVAANAITVSTGSLVLDFRSTSLTSGTVTTLAGTPSSLTIASTDSFGLVTAAGSQRIAILAINNAGTIELAAASLAGGVALDESGVITTATTATTTTAILAGAVRTGVAYRVIGFLDATFTTATGWGSLAVVQGQGGEAITAMSSIGYGQLWTSVKTTPGRTLSTTYYNNTGKPIWVKITCDMTNLNSFITVAIAGVSMQTSTGSAAGYRACCDFMVPVGQSYVVTAVGTLVNWHELR